MAPNLSPDKYVYNSIITAANDMQMVPKQTKYQRVKVCMQENAIQSRICTKKDLHRRKGLNELQTQTLVHRKQSLITSNLQGTPLIANVTACYQQFSAFQRYNYDAIYWNSLVTSVAMQLQSSLYNFPIPLSIPCPPIVPSVISLPVRPFLCNTDIYTDPSQVFSSNISPVLPYIPATYDANYELFPGNADQTVPILFHNESYTNYIEETLQETNYTVLDTEENKIKTDYPLESYLSLPKELFPSAKIKTIDPNRIIDECCKLVNVEKNLPWILDLEFGVPRTPTSRPIAIYDVQLNFVYCKNAPRAIHPDFESCNPEFKKAFLFHYDCIFSAWYRGYMYLFNDASVANFQEWLMPPMQVFGIGWSS